MQHDLQWFLDRVGSYILRGSTEIFINDDKMAKELFKRQSEDYTFTAKVVIHKAPPTGCIACEG